MNFIFVWIIIMYLHIYSPTVHIFLFVNIFDIVYYIVETISIPLVS